MAEPNENARAPYPGSAADDAAKIRAELKAKGWSSKQVSVRAENYSMGSAIRAEVKDVAVPLSVVKRIAEGKEHIRRDGWGEILSGGNRYVSVSHSREAREILERRYVGQVEAAAAQITPGSSSLIPVEGTPFLVGVPDFARDWPAGSRLALWGDSHISEGDAASLAYIIARRLMEAETDPEAETERRAAGRA